MVEFWIRYFKTRGRNTFIQWLVRAESFREIVSPVLADEGLPQEMFFLAMVESGFSNTAYSSKSATGTWQFMGPTARLYNLKINHWVDERRDPVKSTTAAARYLKDLYAQFGDWYLAMAAYNAGPGKVRSAIRRANSRDFWVLAQTPYLRTETKHYVPKVLAALSLNNDLRQHGFEVAKDPAHHTPSSWAAVTRPIQLSEVARELNIPLTTLKHWNPEIIRDITPPLRNEPFYRLRLPDEHLVQWSEVESRVPIIEVTDVMMYKIQPGDTLSQIARRYNTSIGKIKSFNPELRPQSLRVGKQIAIPVPGVVTKAQSSKEFG
jgi:membrane-bound lytic murein transglycosylase D